MLKCNVEGRESAEPSSTLFLFTFLTAAAQCFCEESEMDGKIEQMALAAGFTHVADLRAQDIVLMKDVRDMCAKNSCGMYGKNWSCPPACGTIEECRERVMAFQTGILVQTVGELEDEFDVESMMETEAAHKEHFLQLHDALQPLYPGLLSLGAGTCTRCSVCSYPDLPCRFPEKRFSSMEAYGMLVTQVCQISGMKYYYGSGTISYTSCFLLE